MPDPKVQIVRSRRIAILIAVAGGVLALVMRWFYVMHAQVLQPIDAIDVRADAVDYYRYAWNLVHHATFAVDAPGSVAIHANTFRDPGYPVFLAFWMVATSDFNHWYGGVLLSQAFLGALSVTLVLLALRSRLRNGALATGALLMAAWPHSISMTSFVLTETLTGFLCAAALLCVREAVDRPLTWRLLLTGAILSLAALTNAALTPLGALAALALMCSSILTRRQAATLALASLLLPALWGIRGMTTESSVSGGQRLAMNLVQGSWPTYHTDYQRASQGRADAIVTMKNIDTEIIAFDAGTANGLSRMADRMESQPSRYLRWYAGKPLLLWDWDIQIGQGDIYVYPTVGSPFNERPMWKDILAICYMLNPFILLAASAGVVLAFVRPREGTHITMATLVVAITAIYGILQSEPRYAIPFRNVEIALACLGVARCWELYRGRALSRDARHKLKEG
jgi:hypothetical protein